MLFDVVRIQRFGYRLQHASNGLCAFHPILQNITQHLIADYPSVGNDLYKVVRRLERVHHSRHQVRYPLNDEIYVSSLQRYFRIPEEKMDSHDEIGNQVYRLGILKVNHIKVFFSPRDHRIDQVGSENLSLAFFLGEIAVDAGGVDKVDEFVIFGVVKGERHECKDGGRCQMTVLGLYQIPSLHSIDQVTLTRRERFGRIRVAEQKSIYAPNEQDPHQPLGHFITEPMKKIETIQRIRNRN
jgi:hypothetical protein